MRDSSGFLLDQWVDLAGFSFPVDCKVEESLLCSLVRPFSKEVQILVAFALLAFEAGVIVS